MSALLRLLQQKRAAIVEEPRCVYLGVIDTNYTAGDDDTANKVELERRIAAARADGQLRECDFPYVRTVVNPRQTREAQ
jgi:hypothetical protein